MGVILTNIYTGYTPNEYPIIKNINYYILC